MEPAITIANYEEFFLLYVDGELSSAGQQAVERFVQENPHLADELDMLMQMKLPAEEMVFADKEILFRNGSAEISQENYETHFLLYVDNELDAAGKTAVETFVLQHPSLQEQFVLLKKTKLEPETIVFPDKASLYRKEEKERRVIYMRWQRIAVAAALIGVIALVWTLVPSGNNNDPVVANNTPANATATVPNTTPAQPGNVFDLAPVQENAIARAGNAGNTQQRTIQPVQLPHENLVAMNPVTENGNANEQPQRDVIVRNDPPQTVVSSNTAGIANDPPMGTFNRIIETGNTGLKTGAIIDREPDNNTIAVIAQPAVYKELDTDTEDNKKSLYVGSIEINKDKLRGLFRKASSLFRGKAKQQEEERSENASSSSNTRSLR